MTVQPDRDRDSADGGTERWASICANERNIAADFNTERRRAHNKHGMTSMESQPALSHRRCTILTEEVGEVARALNDLEHATHQGNDAAARLEAREHLRKELTQTGAMVVAWLAALDNHTLPMPVAQEATSGND